MDFKAEGKVFILFGMAKGEEKMNLGVTGKCQFETFSNVKRIQKTAENETSFLERLQSISEKTNLSETDIYQKYLEQKYGNVMFQDVGKDQTSMDRIGAGTAGTGNVVIAPNILEQMEKDPEKAAYYEGKIQDYFRSLPLCKAQLLAMGHEIHSSGIVIHPDGTVTHYVSGDLKPEERARIEAQIKAEDEEKARRKREYQKRSEEAAEARRQEMELAYKKQSAAAAGRIACMAVPEVLL